MKTRDLTILINLVVLEHSELDLLLLVFDFLRCGVVLLLPLLTTTTKSKHEMKSRFLLDVVIRQRASVFQLFTGEDETLLVRWNAFLVLDLGLDVVDRVARFDLEGDGLTREGLHKDLHGGSDWYLLLNISDYM